MRRVLAAPVTRANKLDPPAGDAPAESLYKSDPQAAAWRRGGRHANASQSRVLPSAELAYETGLSAGSIAEFQQEETEKTEVNVRYALFTLLFPVQLVRASGNAPELGTHLVRLRL